MLGTFRSDSSVRHTLDPFANLTRLGLRVRGGVARGSCAASRRRGASTSLRRGCGGFARSRPATRRHCRVLCKLKFAVDWGNGETKSPVVGGRGGRTLEHRSVVPTPPLRCAPTRARSAVCSCRNVENCGDEWHAHLTAHSPSDGEGGEQRVDVRGTRRQRQVPLVREEGPPVPPPSPGQLWRRTRCSMCFSREVDLTPQPAEPPPPRCRRHGRLSRQAETTATSISGRLASQTTSM